MVIPIRNQEAYILPFSVSLISNSSEALQTNIEIDEKFSFFFLLWEWKDKKIRGAAFKRSEFFYQKKK